MKIPFSHDRRRRTVMMAFQRDGFSRASRRKSPGTPTRRGGIHFCATPLRGEYQFIRGFRRGGGLRIFPKLTASSSKGFTSPAWMPVLPKRCWTSSIAMKSLTGPGFTRSTSRWVVGVHRGETLTRVPSAGGFLMADNFCQPGELPDRYAHTCHCPIEDLKNSDEILFHVLDQTSVFRDPVTYRLDLAGPTNARRHRAALARIRDLSAHTRHMGDAWEHADDPRYPERFSSLAYRLGHIIYGMTDLAAGPSHRRPEGVMNRRDLLKYGWAGAAEWGAACLPPA